MASFTRSRGSSRGAHNPRTRGGNRGRGGGRGRGRGNAKAYGISKPTFISSRVEEPVKTISNEGQEGLESEEEKYESIADGLESESDQEIVANTNVKPYSVLLQSLNANIQQGQPQKKKRKVEDTEDSERKRGLEQDLDRADELDEAELADLDDAEDVDEPDSIGNSKFS